MTASAEIGVVVATRDRRDSLLRTLDRLAELPERPPTVVVDNASGDGSAAAVAARHPGVEVLRLRRNRGAFARNLGAAHLRTPLVAFCDDDSWWRPGSLARAAACFRRFPGLGLLAARILVGAENRLDPVSAEMAAGPRPAGLPGPPVDGFLACGAAVRRDAFLAAGGFCERFLIGAEERLLAIDLAAAGWQLCYVEEVEAEHWPDRGSRGDRPWLSRRNALWTAWMRLPARWALRETGAEIGAAGSDPAAARALLAALRGLPWALRMRQVPVPRAASTRPGGGAALLGHDAMLRSAWVPWRRPAKTRRGRPHAPAQGAKEAHEARANGSGAVSGRKSFAYPSLDSNRARGAVVLEHPELSDGRARGALVSQLSREIVQLHARLYGRGPTKARSYLHSDYAACILEEIFTTAERTLIDAGSREHVQDTRKKFQDAVEDEFVDVVERITGRKVRVFLSQVDVDANLALEFFLFEEGEE